MWIAGNQNLLPTKFQKKETMTIGKQHHQSMVTCQTFWENLASVDLPIVTKVKSKINSKYWYSRTSTVDVLTLSW